MLLGSKKALILSLRWKSSKSLRRSPKLGSPGVGQKFKPLSNNDSSLVVRVWVERLRTAGGSLTNGVQISYNTTCCPR